jgi:hypothetical protein
MTEPVNGQPAPASFEERLWVPMRWWLAALLLVASLWLALLVSTPALVTWAATGTAVLLALVLLLGYGGARIAVGPEGVTAGRACLDWPACGEVVALDAERTRAVRGVDADARAFLLLRPYLSQSVQVMVGDPHDPTPYWLLSSRRPQTLAATVAARRAASSPTVQD